jgi:hypothetical protein
MAINFSVCPHTLDNGEISTTANKQLPLPIGISTKYGRDEYQHEAQVDLFP